jgi:hypothetical protein
MSSAQEIRQLPCHVVGSGTSRRTGAPFDRFLGKINGISWILSGLMGLLHQERSLVPWIPLWKNQPKHVESASGKPPNSGTGCLQIFV